MIENNAKKIAKKILLEGENYIAAFFCVAIMLLIFIQVVTRYIFRRSFTWTEEISIIFFVWMSYFAIAAAVTKNKHIRVDFVLKMFPYNGQKLLFILDNLITIVYCVLMVWGTWGLTKNFYTTSAKTLLLYIPKWVCYGVIPLALILTIIRFVQNTVTLIRAKGEPLNVAKPVIDVDALEREYLESLNYRGEH